MNLTQTFSKTWKTFLENKNQLPVIIFSDLLFYYLILLLGKYVIDKLMIIAETIMQTFGNLEEVVGTEIMQNAQIITQYKEVTKLIWLFIGGALLIWIIFKGICWYQTHKINKNKISIKEFILPFFIQSIFWYFLAIATIMIVGYINYLLFLDSANNNGVLILFAVLLAIIAYFGIISYSLVNKKQAIRNAFKTGARQLKTILPAYLFSAFVYLFSLFLAYSIFIRNFYIALVTVLAIILPAIQYTRLLMINIITQH